MKQVTQKEFRAYIRNHKLNLLTNAVEGTLINVMEYYAIIDNEAVLHASATYKHMGTKTPVHVEYRVKP